MQSADQVTAFDPESPEFKAFRQSAISRRHSDLRSAEARNPQKHEAPNQNSKQNKQLYIYAINIIYKYICILYAKYINYFKYTKYISYILNIMLKSQPRNSFQTSTRFLCTAATFRELMPASMDWYRSSQAQDSQASRQIHFQRQGGPPLPRYCSILSRFKN